jgi:hypothetical protein
MTDTNSRLAELEQKIRSIEELAAYCLRGNEQYHTTMVKIHALVGDGRK